VTSTRGSAAVADARAAAAHVRVSVIVPARNEAGSIAATVAAVMAQREPAVELEVLVVDDGSSDGTAEVAEAAGARVLRLPPRADGGNPAAARNRGAEVCTGDILVFLDADCLPAVGWLRGLLDAHAAGHTVVGGALDLPPGLSLTARCDYYCGWYLIHSRRPPGYVPHHPPPNLSVRRDAFFSTSRFTEEQPFSYTNEERVWQAEARRAGHRIYFEPRARVFHLNRPGFGNLLRRNYRWAYTAIESKSTTASARLAWLYRHPRLLIAASVPLAFAHTAYIVGCWLRAGVVEPLFMSPAILVSRFAYVAGMSVGGVQWLRRGATSTQGRAAPRWQ
jgi:glycosyltransferase involved in cell wall biosynthesis